jgi:hypothetical protein
MNDPSTEGIKITKEYCKNGFVPSDLQWEISSIDENVTLYDVFRLVYQINILIPGIPSAFGMTEFEAFWDQINLDREPDDIDDVDYLELYWSPSFDTRMTKKTGKSTDQPCANDLMSKTHNYFDDPKNAEMPNRMSFHGVGSGCPSKGMDLHECGDDCPTDGGYAIEFTPVNNLSCLPVRVSPEVQFYPPYVESDRDFKRTGFKLTIDPTLWCFITSILWELTFVGHTPDAVADQAQVIHDRMDEAKAHMKQMDKEDAS